jgi:hypothetical protein
MSRTRYLVLPVLSFAVTATVQSATLVVDVANCPGPGDGSVGDPYCSIQTAIDNAVDTDEIVVAPGTYFETIDFLGKAIWLHSSDGPEVTIISANGPVGADTAVTCDSGEESTTVLDGFTITGGSGTLFNNFPRGGGMFNNNSSPTVTNCTFSDNTATYGGGMYNHNGSNPSLTNCTFSGNTAAAFGGGMYNSCNSPTVTNCTFSGNSAGFGGGMNNSNSSLTVTNCMFSGNSANLGGGGGMDNINSSPTVTNCTFSGNTAAGGGGMCNVNSSPAVINCTFTGNTAAQNGGGMSNSFFNSLTVTNCTFRGNSATNGHALAFDSSNQCCPNELLMTNCILWNGGDEIWNNDGSTITINYTNVQGGWPGTGNIDADPMFVDPGNGDYRLQAGTPCIDAGDNTAVPQGITIDLDGNPRFLDVPETPDTGNGELPIVDMGAYEALGGGCLAVTSQEVVCHVDGTTFTVNIEGLNACTGGTTQVTFTASGGAVGEELCFTALVNDGGFCCTTEICVTIPDCTPAALPSDLDGDGIVGMVDFLALLAAWGSCSDCGNCPADFDGDCSVGILDLLVLLGNWG